MIPNEELGTTQTSTVHRRRRQIARWIWRNLNFYRIHLLAFILTPLVFSVIFYLSNGQNHISYVDSLFLCVTSLTVCGLATVNLSTLTGFQQAIMYILMWAGHPVTVSIIIVQSRLWIFEDHLEPLVRKRREEREARKRKNSEHPAWPKRVLSVFERTHDNNPAEQPMDMDLPEVSQDEEESFRWRRGRKIKANMIRRMSDAPQRVNPSGLVMELPPTAERATNEGERHEKEKKTLSDSPRSMPADDPLNRPPSIEIRRATTDAINNGHPDANALPRSPTNISRTGLLPLPRRLTRDSGPPDDRGLSSAVPRTQTIEFSLARPKRGISRDRNDRIESMDQPDRVVHRTNTHGGHSAQNHFSEGFQAYPSRVHTFPKTATTASHHRRGAKNTGFGGFPTPFRLLIRFISWVAPNTAERIRLRLTVPRSPSIKLKNTASIASQTIDAALKTEHRMTEKDLEFLGGVEYTSLKLLRSIVLSYHIGIQIIGFAIIIPEAMHRIWRPVLDGQPRFVPPAWFAVFQVTSAYSNTGTSLVDMSMIPFQGATLMIITLFILILAGNTAFPIFLRFFIWIAKKCIRRDAPVQASLHFLLRHPRRCYIYLFPSHQTWFLLTMIVTLTLTDWICFIVLDIGNPVTDSIPIGSRVLVGLLQASAVRAAGFSTVSLSALAPAVKVLYVIMMYVSVYPIAMSVRSTNVYEEKSLGIFKEFDTDSESSSLLEEEDRFGRREGESRRKVWGEYLLYHAKQQLAFDMWWLGLGLWLICIIERGPLTDTENRWFDIFTLVFEIVSAYGTVGLSLGIPHDNYSTSGAFKPLSKLIICAVMIRGRHRGLPVAIDRAIVLPNEYNKREKYGQDFVSNSQIASGLPSSLNQDAVRSRDISRDREKDAPTLVPALINTEHSGLVGDPEKHRRQRSMTLEAVPESSMSTTVINATNNPYTPFASSLSSLTPSQTTA